ncbi:hypothetical protein GCM10009820_16680 [Leifsonia soli]
MQGPEESRLLFAKQVAFRLAGVESSHGARDFLLEICASVRQDRIVKGLHVFVTTEDGIRQDNADLVIGAT